MTDLGDERRMLMQAGLDPETVDPDPYRLLADWLSYAEALSLHNANAMAVATVAPDGSPSVRNVLYRGAVDGRLSFYTNYNSHKGEALSHEPRCEALFSWLLLERQIRCSGTVDRLSAGVSDAYFDSRARSSRIASMASPQSQTIADRSVLTARVAEIERDLDGADPVRPAHWGGYGLLPDRFEFWQGRDHRLHDRIVYERRGEAWEISRLAP